MARLYSSERPPPVQIVVSDGLNARAINEQLPVLLPALLQSLKQAGIQASTTHIVIANGRVRAGYHVGQLIDATVIVHLIGERPGTGLNTVSAYMTYGRDQAGRSRWSPDLDHSWTTAICGIHPSGTPPVVAAAQIARDGGASDGNEPVRCRGGAGAGDRWSAQTSTVRSGTLLPVDDDPDAVVACTAFRRCAAMVPHQSHQSV